MSMTYTAKVAPAALALLSSLLLAPTRVHAQNVTVKGSDTMVLLGQKWAEVYMQKNSGAKIQVTGGGSGTGIAALTNGTTDIAESSRPMKPQEVTATEGRDGGKVKEQPVALDALSIYVGKSNPIEEISLPQLRKIYTGAIGNWKEVGGADAPINLYSRENNSGTYVFFKEHVLQNDDFDSSAQTLPGTAAVVNAVAKDANGIGYGGIAFAEGVKRLKVKKDDLAPAVEAMPGEPEDLAGAFLGVQLFGLRAVSGVDGHGRQHRVKGRSAQARRQTPKTAPSGASNATGGRRARRA